MNEALKYVGSVIGALLLFAVVAGVASDHESPRNLDKAVYMVRAEQGHGTGFFIGRNRIITAAHVAKMAGEDKQLTITRDGMEFKAIVLWMDETRDVAMLKITDPHAFEKAPKARLSCDSPDAVIGTKVHSIGYPLDLGLTHTWGRVGSKPWKHRTEDDGSGGETYQTLDIAIAPGNSGGPIFDQTGEVIGLSDAVPVVPMGPFAVSLAPYGLIIPRTSICNSMIEHIPQEVASN